MKLDIRQPLLVTTHSKVCGVRWSEIINIANIETAECFNVQHVVKWQYAHTIYETRNDFRYQAQHARDDSVVRGSDDRFAYLYMTHERRSHAFSHLHVE